jgi:hypothetical protein
MGMPVINGAKIGDLQLLMYDYQKAGDCLPMHNHDDATSHIIIVARGRVLIRIIMENGAVENGIHESGTVLDTFAGFPHEIIGLEDNARTVHITKKLAKEPEHENGNSNPV